MLQNFQQQPVKPETNTQPPPQIIQPQAPNVSAGLGMVAPQPPLPSQPAQLTQPAQQKTAFDKVTMHSCICMMFFILFYFIFFYLPSGKKVKMPT